MGGSGSGRWYGHDKKRTVEESWSLDVAGLSLGDALEYPLAGTLQAIRSVGVSKVLPVRYTLVEEDDGPILNLTFASPRRSLLDWALEERLRLLATRPTFGGVRWWFACPFTVEGERCNRRVAKLYLPPQGTSFACRRCHGLTYESSQESHAYDSLAALMAGGQRSGPAYEIMRTYLHQVAKEARRQRREAATSSGLLEAFERKFGLGERP